MAASLVPVSSTVASAVPTAQTFTLGPLHMPTSERVSTRRHQYLSYLEPFMWPSKEPFIHQLVTIGGAAASTTAFQAAATSAATAVRAAAGSLMVRTAAATTAEVSSWLLSSTRCL